jgi:hypothetical protein
MRNMERIKGNYEMPFNNINGSECYDDEFLDESEKEVMEILRDWMHNSTPIPEYPIEPVIKKIRQAPIVLDMDSYGRTGEESFPTEKAERIIKHDIIPALRTIVPRTGENASEVIKKAKKSVCVTHFSREGLEEDYIQGLLDLLDKGIQVTRIVYFHKDYLENYKWLKRFRKSGRLLLGYKELVYKAVPTPLDIVIVDGSKALLSFPILDMNQFFDAVVVTEERVVKSFCQVFSTLVLNSKTIDEAQNCKRLGVPEYLKLHNTNLRKIKEGLKNVV